MSGPASTQSEFTLDRFQRDGNAAIDRGESVLVVAPTGAGKTAVAEHAVDLVLREGGRLFYTTPIKALSNQKFRDLVDKHGSLAVGLLTGDVSIRRDAPVVVMTTEVLRNMAYSDPDLSELTWVVLDEIHYLSDPVRGPVWEEVIVHLPEHIRLVCLSATVSNHVELAEWIRSVRGPTDCVVETHRPVPLLHEYAVSAGRHSPPKIVPLLKNGRFDRRNRRFDPVAGRSRHRRKGPRWRTPRRDDLLFELQRRDLLPTIFFIFSRARCDEAADRLYADGARLTTRDEANAIEEIARRHCAVLDQTEQEALGVEGWLTRLRAGIAAHHAGMVPAMKETVETTFAAGLVPVVFATETLALGINMPARSVVVENLSKYNGETHELLTPGQYAQLSGRAGRRGLDDTGVSIVQWSPFVAADEVGRIVSTNEFPLESAFSPTYNMVANLIGRHDRAETERLLGQSFAQFQIDRTMVDLNRRIAELRADIEHESPAHTTEGGTDHRAKRARKQLRRLERRADQHDGALINTLDRVLEVLSEHDFVDGWELTERGELLRRLHGEHGILMAASIDDGLLDGLDEPELAGVVSVLTYQPRNDAADPAWLPEGEVRARVHRIAELHREIERSERRHRVGGRAAPDAGFYAYAQGWTIGLGLDDLLDDDVVAGEFVRNTRQVGDALDQIARLAERGALATTAAAASQRIRRSVVAATVGESGGSGGGE